ncbi:MAG: ABC transporter permease [Pseudolabrys sp.]|nr:ABC transporter permease [Pseudolabrys sp.]
MNRSSRNALVLASPSLAWLLLFVALPCIFMVVMACLTTGIFGIQFKFTAVNFERLFQSPLYVTLLFKTFRIAIVTTAITLIMAYPLAIFLSRQRPATKGLLLLLLFLPFWIGYVVRTFAWLPILGRAGIINQMLLDLGVINQPVDWLLYNEFAVYLGLVYVYLLFMLLPVFLAIDRIEPALYEAAQDLGASRWRVFTRIVLPMSKPGALSGAIMVFLLTFGAFVTPALLGGASGIMYSNVIATQFFANNNWAFGSALSTVMTAVVIAFLVGSSRFIGLRDVFLSRAGDRR